MKGLESGKHELKYLQQISPYLIGSKRLYRTKLKWLDGLSNQAREVGSQFECLRYDQICHHS